MTGTRQLRAGEVQRNESTPTRLEPAKRSFRGDIQALRALAVVAVILNHLWPGQITGGYAGVDIFFVISGYLITSHILRDAAKEGRIRLAAFWARRAARLLPAAFVVLLACFLITVFIIPITQRRENFVEIGAAATYVLNWVLAANSLDYFAQSDAHTLVTHYWSLSVEEQFYILWPLLLTVLLLAARRMSPRRKTVLLSGSFIVVIGLSFGWAVFAVAHMPPAAYFQTTGRAWEFAVGGLAALVPAVGERGRRRLFPLVAAAWLALVLCVVLLKPTAGFPGTLALIPVLATAAVIVIGEAETSWRSLRRLTSFGPIQMLGRVSYSAYLWHYPLIIGTAAVIGHLSGLVKAALFVATVLLALCSQRLLEEPARRWLTTKLQAGPVLVGTGCAMVVALVVCLGATAHIDARADAAASRLRVDSAQPSACFGAQAVLSGAACPSSHQLQASDDLLVKAEMHGPPDMLHSVQYREVSVGGAPLSVYEFGASIRSATDTVALVGDSHAAMWWPALDVVARRNGVHVVSVTRQGCVLTLDENVPGRPGETDCRQWRAAALDYVVNSDRIDRVIVAGRAMLYVDDDGQPARSTGYVAAWRAMMLAGKHVVVVADVPDYGLPPVQCPAGGTSTDCGMPRSQIADTGWSDAAAAIQPGPLFSLADLNDLLCDARVCHTIVGGIPAYADSNHLSSYFVRSIGESFYDRVLSGTDH